MSLQIWLPLNGDLHNQGLSNIQFTNNGATVDINGKIGECYLFNGSSNFLKATHNFYNNKYSVCAWVYSTSSTATQTICCDRTATGSGFSIFLIGGKLRIDPGGNHLMWTTSYTYPINTWFHLAITYNGTNVSYYINGEYKETKAQAISSSYWGNTTSIGASQTNNSNYGNYLNGKLNDVRIYNHALSAKEVKKISKGLVLHWQLNGPKKLIVDTDIPENLFISSGFSQHDIDNMVGNSSTDWTKYFRWYNGSKSIHTFADGVDTIKLNATGNLGIAFTRKATDINLDPNSYYIVSCEAKCTKSGAQLGIGTSYYTTGNSWTWRGGANKFSFNAVDTWQTFTYKFKPDSNTQYICYCFTCANGTSGGTDTFSIRHCKLEKGSTATTWNLNKLDDTYISNLIENTSWTEEYDCSGFNNNGIIIGTPILGTNVPNLSYGIYMNNTNSANRIQSNAKINIPQDQVSVSFWTKFDKSKAMVIFADPKIEFAKNTSTYAWLRRDSSVKGFSLSNFNTNQWNHIVTIRNGTDYYLYINGVAAAQNGSNNNWTHNGDYLYLLNRNYNNNYAADASICDFRIYATILSADDVKELYRNSKIINGENKFPRDLE